MMTALTTRSLNSSIDSCLHCFDLLVNSLAAFEACWFCPLNQIISDMITQEQDPDVVRWSRELFDCDPYNNLGYCGALVPSDGAHYYPEGHYFKNNHCGGGLLDYSNVGTDELGGCRSLEHEFSRFTVAEVAGSSKDEELERHLQAPIYPPEWFGQSVVNHASEHESGGQEEVDDTVPSSSCCSPGEESYCGEDWSYSLDLMDEYSLDGEMGKRLNQMASVPHVPRINGEIPTLDEATLDHQRLLDRLQLYDLFENKVQGDGNCQFRALSDQFYRSPEHHEFVRQQVVNQLKSHPEIYEGYVPMAYVDYIEKMSKSGEWGDHVTLQAAADSYGIKIFVITSFKDTCYIEIIPNVEKSKRVICLSFWAEVHYNSIYPLGEEPVFETKKKRRWRIFRHKHVEPPDEFQQ